MDSSHCQRSGRRDQVPVREWTDLPSELLPSVADRPVREWTDLPSELLPSVADRLGLIELLSFRGVCKDWNSASSTASAEVEALPNREPWFLLYGENNNSQCILITESGKQYTITIPEMDGTTCLASTQGWLLLYREGSLFFFCPFSRAKIELQIPCQFPASMEISEHVALFSAPPTSKDCVIGIICRTKEREALEINVIRRGDTAWTKHKLGSFLNKIECAAYHNGVFYYFDNAGWMVCFSTKDRSIRLGKVIYAKPKSERCLPLRFSAKDEKQEMKNRLALALGEGSQVSICGTIISAHPANKMVPYENIGNANKPGTPKGVWFQPRFHQIDQNQIW